MKVVCVQRLLRKRSARCIGSLVIILNILVTAITLVALGTSLPDTFASMTAAKNADSADSAIGNITGSNSVNVFLGLGLPWSIAVTFWAANEDDPRIAGRFY